MTENKNELKSLGVSLTIKQWERCEKLAEEHNKKSRNAFIREAVDFYCAWLEKEYIEKFFCRRANPSSRQRYATANLVSATWNLNWLFKSRCSRKCLRTIISTRMMSWKLCVKALSVK